MNKLFYIIVIILLALFTDTKAQKSISGNNYQNIVEKLELITDRQIYTVGETIYLSVIDTSGINNTSFNWSKVVYIELITYDGIAFVQQKIDFNYGLGEGIIDIPVNLPTGNYYLKCYTKWLRNFGTQAYCYQPVTIINYKNSELLPKPIGYLHEFKIDTLPYKVSKERLFAAPNQQVIKKQEIVINLSDNLKNGFGVISIVPQSLVNTGRIVVSPVLENTFDLKFIPETRGVTLSGIVIDKDTDKGIPYVNVNLSVIDNNNYSMSCLADSNGRFYFSLPEFIGKKEILITALDQNNSDLSILVDNDFCNKLVKLPFLAFEINENISVIENLIKRSIVNSEFADELEIKGQQQTRDLQNFYYKPTTEIFIDDYIAMPGLRDYFYELIPTASIRENNGQLYIQINGNSSDLRIFKPLVMIDNVIISQVDRILEIAPINILKIEVVNKPYIIGNVTYGGVVHFFSKNHDFGGIELPESGVFFNYNLIHKGISKVGTPDSVGTIPVINNLIYFDAFNYKKLEPTIRSNVGDNQGVFTIILKQWNKETGWVIDSTAIDIK